VSSRDTIGEGGDGGKTGVANRNRVEGTNETGAAIQGFPQDEPRIEKKPDQSRGITKGRTKRWGSGKDFHCGMAKVRVLRTSEASMEGRDG